MAASVLDVGRFTCTVKYTRDVGISIATATPPDDRRLRYQASEARSFLHRLSFSIKVFIETCAARTAYSNYKFCCVLFPAIAPAQSQPRRTTMPRDLFGRVPQDAAELTASPETQNSGAAGRDDGLGLGPSRGLKVDNKALSDLHPYCQTLSSSDVASCVALENATFPENERCSREKVIGHLLGQTFSASCCSPSRIGRSLLRAARYWCYLLHAP